MAKKKNSFNMAEEIRAVLRANRKASNKDVFAALTEKFGKGSFNQNSCGVAVSNQRKKMGISSGRSVKRKKPKAGGSTVRRSTRRPAVDLTALQAAKSLMASVGGDQDAAIAAIRQLNSLQIG